MATHHHKCNPNYLRGTVVTTPIAHIGLPLTAIEIATATATETGTGTGTVITTEGWIRPVAADGTTNPIRTMNADTPPPRVATLGARTDTDPVATVKAHANENAPRDTKTTITAADLLLIDTDRPARITTTMTMTKIQKNAGDVGARSGIAERIGIARGRDKTTRQTNHLAHTTRRRQEVTMENTRMRQVYTRANTDLGMTPTRCLSRITL